MMLSRKKGLSVVTVTLVAGRSRVLSRGYLEMVKLFPRVCRVRDRFRLLPVAEKCRAAVVGRSRNCSGGGSTRLTGTAESID